jgi:hypothetical protein
MGAEVSEDISPQISGVVDASFLVLKWRQQVPLRQLYPSTKQYGVTYEKTIIFAMLLSYSKNCWATFFHVIPNSKLFIHSTLHNLCIWETQKAQKNQHVQSQMNLNQIQILHNYISSFSGSSGETTSSISSTSSSGSAEETGQLALFSFISPTQRSNEQHYLRATLAGNMHFKNGLLLSSKEKCGMLRLPFC